MAITLKQREGTVPPQALLLSLLSLWVPIVGSSMFPDWTRADVGILIWLLALVPPFLLSYYRGWKGASLALAAGMAAFAVAQVIVTQMGAEPPRVEVLLGTVLVLIVVSLGSGAVAAVLHRSLGEAEEMALTDPGTGLANRRHGTIHLHRAFAAAQRGAPLAVVVFDLDRFKSINDRFGHQTGDEVLQVFAGILARMTRAMHLAVRFGGEEFMVILDGSTAEGAVVMAERVLEATRTHTFPWGNVTVSAGISEYEPGMASPEVLVAAADQALYRSKAGGRDQVTVLARQGSDVRGLVTTTQAAAPAYQTEGNGELVLIVDDDPAVLRVLARALRRRRYQPVEASDPQQALTIARGLMKPIDLVITDIVMPGMSGFRLVEMLMEIQPQLRALYISGYGSDEIRWSGVPGTVKAFLPKPISINDLTAAVGRSLDTRFPDLATPAAAPAEDPVVEDPSISTPPGVGAGDAYGEIIHRLGWAAEYRDDATGGHAERVGSLAGRLFRELGQDDAAVKLIERAAVLHDVGKIAVPDSVLNKPDSLTPLETEIMHRHSVVGAHLLSGSRDPMLQEAERVARWHHERWDGGGYPDGLTGEAIPLSARVVAVADAYDSMTHARAYRPAVTPDQALAIIRRERGRQFDPGVVDALERVLAAGGTAVAAAPLASRWQAGSPSGQLTGTGCRTAPV